MATTHPEEAITLAEQERPATVAVVGGGVIGLAIAWRAAQAGFAVEIFDPQPGGGASWVAGGMLAPLSEGWPGEEHLLEFGAASLARWPGFARDLGAPLFTSEATLTLACDAADAADLRTVSHWLDQHGHRTRLLDRAAIRELEPDLSRVVRLALCSEAEPAVDNRALVRALQTQLSQLGVRINPVRVTDVRSLSADRVVVAAGAGVRALLPDVPVRPVKGEILRLRRRASSTRGPRHTVRANVRGRAVYLVPRTDGFVLGATQYEAADTEVTVGGVRDLLADAETIFPGVADYELAESAAGLRPVCLDNLPVIGHVDERVIVAGGHGRNGILLTPITADAVVAELSGTPLSEAAAAAPSRFG